MTPEQDLVLLAGSPTVQYELLRDQVLNGARQRCLDVAIANGYEPDPLPPADEALEPSCYEAVDDFYRDGCCAVRSDECGGARSCGPGDTDGADTEPGGSGGLDSADGTTGEGVMSSLDELYHHIDCAGSTCHVEPPLIEAVLSQPEAVLAEGTSLRPYPTDAPTGLRLEGVEPGGLADRLGLREGDQVLAIDDLPLTTEAELLAALGHAIEADAVAVRLRRDGEILVRWFVREP